MSTETSNRCHPGFSLTDRINEEKCNKWLGMRNYPSMCSLILDSVHFVYLSTNLYVSRLYALGISIILSVAKCRTSA